MSIRIAKQIVKGALHALGLEITRRDRLAELIPPSYETSLFLPRLYRQTLGRALYFKDIIERTRDVEGDVVECGVSIGHGLLQFMLLGEFLGVERRVYGFDSFSGFPRPSSEDQKADGSQQVVEGYYATPQDLVNRVLLDGRLTSDAIQRKLILVPGYFEDTLDSYKGQIAVLHLDCDLYSSYKTCLERLYDLVVPGGVIMLDEYEDDLFPGARRAVDEFLANKPERAEAYDRFQYNKFFIVKQPKGHTRHEGSDRCVPSLPGVI